MIVRFWPGSSVQTIWFEKGLVVEGARDADHKARTFSAPISIELSTQLPLELAAGSFRYAAGWHQHDDVRADFVTQSQFVLYRSDDFLDRQIMPHFTLDFLDDAQTFLGFHGQ